MRLYKYVLILVLITINNFLFTQSPFIQLTKDILDNSNYIICIDGGGSKTELQVLNRQGELVELVHNGVITYSIKSGGSNINVVGIDGIKDVLCDLLNDFYISGTDFNLSAIMSQVAFIGGFSGADAIESQNKIKNLLKDFGFDENRIVVTSDSVMTIQSLHGDGIILISGTGSICLGRKDSQVFRVGGLGRLIGDQGSGYYIGIRALRAALEYEFGWGVATSLKLILRDYFKTLDLKNIITFFYNGKITNQQIAAISPIVFEQAEQGDIISLKIINKAAKELGKMLFCMIKKGSFLPTDPVFLFGGIFKGKNSNLFIQKILKSALVEELNVFNKSEFNPTVLAVQQLLLK